jgi:hypothetical protein
MAFVQKIAWSVLTNLFAAWIVIDTMLSKQLDNVGSEGLLKEYDFIIGNHVFLLSLLYRISHFQWEFSLPMLMLRNYNFIIDNHVFQINIT